MYADEYIDRNICLGMSKAIGKFWMLLLVGAMLGGCQQEPPAPRIAAASDLRTALTQVAAAFERDEGTKVELVFGSSGNFHQQLSQGAPFEVFFSADEHYVLDLAKAGKAADQGRLYAIGRIALIAPKGSPLSLDPELKGLRTALANGAIRHFAIANPEHAPYGKRAREALEHAGLWQAVQARLVLGENVSQALQFVADGGAQGGIVALSLARDPALADRANHVIIPQEWHQPLRQRMVLMKGAGSGARRFYAFASWPVARAIFQRHGFALPAGPD
jgi:molybdate transport system substrate-binding protein